MTIKKAESAGDKIIRFVGFFLRLASDKDNQLLGNLEADASVMPETPTTRLTSQLLEAVVPLMTAKDKVVRFRSTQLVSHTINSLDAIDDDLFQKIRHGLLKRIRDKEAMVRSQAVLGLGRLAGNQSEGCTNSDDSNADEDTGLLQKLLEVLQNDPSADVRRSLLVNLPILPNTLPYLLERARDQDPPTRRAVYSRLLPALGDFRHLSLSMREKLLRWGLRDRDENVRKAAGRLFRERWIEDCAGVPAKEDSQTEAPTVSFDGLLELLERIDVINSGVENGVALEAMSGFWEGRPDYREAMTLDDAYWETLSAESAFMARSFNDFCRNEGNGKYVWLVEEKLPEVTKLAFYMERYLQVLVEALKRAAQQEGGEEEEEEEEDTVEQEFIVEQLLHISMTLDYSDEVGRRKMFTLLRQSLSIPDLPDEVTKLTVEVLQHICTPDVAGEREFCSIVLESVADVHDTIIDDPVEDAEESFHSAKSEISGRSSTPTRAKGGKPDLSEEEAREKAVREIVVNMKCLHIVQCMLTHVAGKLQDNADLVSMLNNLVVPAVRSHEAPVRERGLVCLGLCALLDRSLAEENLGLFIHFFSKGHPALQITALHILTDILNVHGAQLLSSTPGLLKVYLKAIKGGKTAEVQATATVAATKLLLGRVVQDEEACHDLLKCLVVAYFDPSSAHNQTVRQALNYFLPVFCYSRPENQDLMRSVALDALHALYNVREGLEDDDDVDVGENMISLTAIGACLVDWTDPRKCYSYDTGLDVEKKNVNGDVHLEFSQDILDKLRSNVSSKSHIKHTTRFHPRLTASPEEEKKLFSSLLGKLCISPGSSEDRLREAYTAVSDAVEEGLLNDATSRNALYKIHVSLGKIVNAMDKEPAGQGNRSMSVAMDVAVNRHSVGERAAEDDIEEVDGENKGEAIEPVLKSENDSIVDDLLSDDEDTAMQDD